MAETASTKKRLASEMESGDDPFEVRRHIFKAGALFPGEDYKGPGKWTLVAPGFGHFANAEPLDMSYFAIRALGQLQQICCEVAGHPYRYTVMTVNHFREHVKSTLVFGRLPLLKTPGGAEIVQSKAVVRYVAKVCGLAGKSDDETARVDMLHEMLLTEGKLDSALISSLTADLISSASAGEASMKDVSRREMMGFDETKKLVLALKFWDEQCGRSPSGWMLGGLGDKGPDEICYVDLSIYWTLRENVSILKDCGYDNLVKFVARVEALDGIKRLFSSGRLMPKIGDGYVYQGDDLVPAPKDV
jgi:glutathione S-transferase